MICDRKPSSTRPFRSRVVVCVALSCLVFAGGQAVSAPDLAQTVRVLGLRPEDPGHGFDLLALEPQISLGLLVGQLHPIPHRTYYQSKKTDQSRHVIACLQALRYLTGRTFVAATSRKLSEDERQFLDFDKEMHDSNPSHMVHFFSVWMSRDADFVAPTDAQLAIIKQWRRFQKEHARDFSYKPAKSAAQSIDDWYWFGIVAVGL